MQPLKIKQVNAPPIAETTGEAVNLAQLTAISRYTLIVGQLRERRNTYNDLPQLPKSLQKVWKASKRIATIPVQSMQTNIRRRTRQAARRNAA